MNIYEMVMASLSDKLRNGDISRVIDIKIDKMFSDILDETLNRYNNPFKKALIEKLDASLMAKVNELSVEAQSEFIIKSLNLHLGIEQKGNLKAIQELISEYYKKPDDKYLLSDLLKYMIDDFDFEYFDKDNITIIQDEKAHGSFWLHIDKEPRKDRHRCEYKFLISDNDTIYLFTQRDYRGELNAFELAMQQDRLGTLIHKMIMHRSKLEIDV